MGGMPPTPDVPILHTRVLLGAMFLSQGTPAPYPAGNERVACRELLRSAAVGGSSGGRTGRGVLGVCVCGTELVYSPSKGGSYVHSDL